MKYLVILLVLCICVTPVYADVILPSGVRIACGAPAPKMPAEVRDMTPQTFYAWATERNRLADQAAQDKAHYREPLQGTSVRADYYYQGDTAASLIGLGPVQQTRRMGSYTERTVPLEFPGSTPWAGGPVLVINPYCYDYWRRQVE